MTDIRARLADALREHLLWPGTHCRCAHELEGPGGPGERRLRYQAHLADVLLSLPGIAITELPEPRTVKPGIVLLHDGWCTARRARELAADLLASAVAAEALRPQSPSPADTGEDPWPGDNVLGAWR